MFLLDSSHRQASLPQLYSSTSGGIHGSPSQQLQQPSYLKRQQLGASSHQNTQQAAAYQEYLLNHLPPHPAKNNIHSQTYVDAEKLIRMQEQRQEEDAGEIDSGIDIEQSCSEEEGKGKGQSAL